MATNVDSMNVSVLTTVQFFSLVEAYPLSNVVLRDKRADRFIVLKCVGVFAEKDVPTKAELLNAWRAMYFNTWKMKFEIENHSHQDVRSGNLFRNLDRFDVLMYLSGKNVFDTANFNLDLVEGKVGLTPKSKVREDFATNKALKAHCYKVAESAWKLLEIDTLIAKALQDAEKGEESANDAKEKPQKKATSGKKATPAKKEGKLNTTEVETPTTTEQVKPELAEAA